MVSRRVKNKLQLTRHYDGEALKMVLSGNSFTVPPGQSLTEMMDTEVRSAKSGFYKNGLILGRAIFKEWREGQEYPYYQIRAQVIKCKRDNENPDFTRGVATILAILIEPYGWQGARVMGMEWKEGLRPSFESTVNYVLSMEE
jgi:hypothetical protein